SSFFEFNLHNYLLRSVPTRRSSELTQRGFAVRQIGGSCLPGTFLTPSPFSSLPSSSASPRSLRSLRSLWLISRRTCSVPLFNLTERKESKGALQFGRSEEVACRAHSSRPHPS